MTNEIYPDYGKGPSPVPLLQNEWEFGQLLELFILLNAKRLLEIGTFYGGTLYHWITYDALSLLENVVCVDLPIGTYDGRYEKLRECKRLWQGWVETHAPNMQFSYIEGQSQKTAVVNEVQRRFGEKKVDFLFIDGGHYYEEVRQDYQNYSPLVREGGIIALHDVVWGTDVARFWRELKESGVKYKEIVHGGESTLGIGVVYK